MGMFQRFILQVTKTEICFTVPQDPLNSSNILYHSFVSAPYTSGRLVVRKGKSVSQSLR